MITNLNGVNIYYEVHGKGEPVVLIAGLAAHSQHWPNQLGVFSKQYQTIVLDNRNSGRSDVTTNCNIRIMADDVISLLDQLQISSTHIIGRSMGGYIAQEIAINYPSRVKKLILEAAAPISSTRNNLLLENFLSLKEECVNAKFIIKEFLFWGNSPLLINDPKILNETIDAIIADPYSQSTEGFRNQINAAREHDTRNRLYKIQSPTLVIAGKEDILITPKESKVLVSNIKNATWRLIEKSGHDIHSDQADFFNKIILEFLR